MSKQQQTERLRELASQGYSKAEAADREGVSHSTAAAALKGTKLKWSRSDYHRQAYGMDDKGMAQFSNIIGWQLGFLHDHHPLVEVQRMTGMNEGEIARAIRAREESRPYSYSLATIARIAKATDKSFLELINSAYEAMERSQ